MIQVKDLKEMLTCLHLQTIAEILQPEFKIFLNLVTPMLSIKWYDGDGMHL